MRLGVAAAIVAAGLGICAPAAARPLVAVIDSGVAQTAELKPYLVGDYDMAADRGAYRPRYDHGTMVATIIKRESHGTVDIVSFRIDDPAGCPAGVTPPCQPAPGPIAASIRKAIALKVDAINISLAVKEDPSITAAIEDAAAHGIEIVLAAGNEGLDHPGNLNMAIAGYPNTVLVGAVDRQGQPWAETNRPELKHSGSYNYVWQLGVNVPGSLADGSAAAGTGTSFAAPIETARRLLSREASVTTASAY